MGLKLNNFFDDLVGELQKDTITTIYGPPAIGKSTICFQYAVSCLKEGKKVIFVDTEGGFSVERIKQMDDSVDLNNIIVISPKTFEDQQKAIVSLNKQIKNASSIGLVIVDSIVMLYRLKLGDAPSKINSELGEQLRLLTEISRTFHIPVLVTNHMYTNFDSKVKRMSGGNVMEYWSKTIIELDNVDGTKFACLKKHKSKPESSCIEYDFENSGLVGKKSGRGFGFFKN